MYSIPTVTSVPAVIGKSMEGEEGGLEGACRVVYNSTYPVEKTIHHSVQNAVVCV